MIILERIKNENGLVEKYKVKDKGKVRILPAETLNQLSDFIETQY